MFSLIDNKQESTHGNRRVSHSGAGGPRFLLPLVAALALSWTFVDVVMGTTYRVPYDFPTIAQAAAVAQLGDSILVWAPPGGSYDGETVYLSQGVTLRGMSPIWPPSLYINDSFVYMLESPPQNMDDTTRVESLHFYNSSRFHENIQVYSPRGSIVGCSFNIKGPLGWPAIRVWKGGLIARSRFEGIGEEDCIAVREGVVRVEGNVFAAVWTPFSVLNQGASQPVTFSFRNNTAINTLEGSLQLRPDSYAEVVDNIFWHWAGMFCDGGTISVRYNDLYDSSPGCYPGPPLGPGNIFDDPMFCYVEPSSMVGPPVHPDSPCVGSGENGATMGAGGVCDLTGLRSEDGTAGAGLHLRIQHNPVLREADFRFDSALVAPVLEIYDPSGKLIDAIRPKGGRALWNAASTPRGVYFARLRTPGRTEVVKFLVLR